jgi:hypothetical protein
MKVYNNHVKKVYCKSGKSVCMVTRRQEGGSLVSSLLKMGVKGAKRLLKNVNFSKIAKSVFNSGKRIAVDSAKGIYNDNKDHLKKQAQDALESLAKQKGNQIVDGLKKSNNLSEAFNSVKHNITDTPKDASKILNNLVNKNKVNLTKSVKQNVSKNIKKNVSKDKLDLANDAANIVSPQAGKVLSNIIEGKGVKSKPKRRTIKGRGISVINGNGLTPIGTQSVP